MVSSRLADFAPSRQPFSARADRAAEWGYCIQCTCFSQPAIYPSERRTSITSTYFPGTNTNTNTSILCISNRAELVGGSARSYVASAFWKPGWLFSAVRWDMCIPRWRERVLLLPSWVSFYFLRLLQMTLRYSVIHYIIFELIPFYDPLIWL
jgi:hypothetical protein